MPCPYGTADPDLARVYPALRAAATTSAGAGVRRFDATLAPSPGNKSPPSPSVEDERSILPLQDRLYRFESFGWRERD
jgi:hypothetical protein